MHIQKGRNKTAPICKLHDYIHRKSQEIYQKTKQNKQQKKNLLEQIHLFSKIVRHKINIHNQYTSKAHGHQN